MEVVVAVEAKLVALAIGLAIAGVGIAFGRFGSPVITALNRLYSSMPGRFQYPLWWHKLVGALFFTVGMLIAIVGLLTAGRS